MNSDCLGDLSLAKGPEFQVIIIVEYDDGRMFPLTEDVPKCLLPVSNRPLLSYQLDILERSGALEVFIVAPADYKAQLSMFLDTSMRANMSIDLIFVEEMLGSCDALRAVQDRIRGDFIVFGSDVFSELIIPKLVLTHRVQTSDITMLFSAVIPEEPEKKGAPKKLNIDQEDQEFVGLWQERVVMKLPAAEASENLIISKPLLNRCSGMNMRTDLLDIGIYVVSHWILEVVGKHKFLSSIRTDLVPYLVNRQFQDPTFLEDSLPGFSHRKRPLKALESWLTSSPLHPLPGDSSVCQGPGPSLAGLLSQQMHSEESRTRPPNPNPNPSHSLSPHVGKSCDPLRCCYVLLEPEREIEMGTRGRGDLPTAQRLTTNHSYLKLNREFITRNLTDEGMRLWPIAPGFKKKEQSVVGNDCDLGDKIILKQSTIDSGCRVSAKTKVNSCVLMKTVQIGEGCTIQNSVICPGAIIESNSNLNECYIGSGTHIPSGSKLKSEAMSSAETV
mmetsp:Transcript_27875/g.28142  ORF Transcript_27875/g.28142 Transcript_27875/m.28142 type:complete len:501 (+) Transcript_27875:156-1658(+)|eukprot:CAMPEP_0182422450 /NCGR_PEP_ID=MMETSP1167-20130531/8155_1 /TAXON_ID=2988 /ORGANISM="Mallomonas Sp, Strain CCMP3275" /LENGTH=500 /DNA_ID=CAMNT_0024600525 /DNA_START=115 /DNA_END=1617 /DNA_ORIENTATION=+